jgi:hypothetical protein
VPKRPASPWVGGVLLCLTDHIHVRLGQAKRQTNPWVGGVLLCVTDLLQGQVRLGICYNRLFVTLDVL